MKILGGIPVAAFSAALVFIGCTKTQNVREGIDPKPAVQAPSQVADSLGIIITGAETPTTTDHAQIVLKKTSLDKEFLLMGEMIEQQPVPSFHGLKSRVVAFKEINGKLYLLEATGGHQIANDLPINLVLTEFPIVREDDSQIVFDFNAGMAAIFVQGDWFAEDDSADYKYSLDHVNVQHSYIESARIASKSNTLVVRQIAQVDVKGDSGAIETAPIEVKYYLSPYSPDPTFQPVVSEGMKKFGYFEVAPQLYPDGSSYIRIAHFQTDKPIVYAISANTPIEYRQAIRDAILYWNTVFGRELLQVVQLTDPSITAPDPDYNIVQWINNDEAGFAYADAQMDPRSGQVLHAQVYLTSVFGSIGKLRAERDLRDSDTSRRQMVTLKGFQQTPMCEHPSAGALATLDSTLAANDLSEAQVLKMAQDYVREVVAHEVGHTLGLRHNFAGNLASNFALSDRKSIVAQYLTTSQTPADVRVSSSIMDYLLFEESALVGDEIARGVASLEYDTKAIRHLYEAKNYDSVPAFCTDTDVKKYLDCTQFDAGSSFVEYAIWSVQNSLNSIPFSLLNSYITAKVPLTLGTPVKAVDQVALNSVSTAVSSMTPRFGLYKAFTTAGNLVAVRSKFPFINPLNEDQVKASELDYVSKQLDPYGGVAGGFTAIDPNFATNAFAQFSTLLDSPRYTSGIQMGKPFAFSPAEKEIMKANAKIYLDQLQDKLVIMDLMSLGGQALPDEDGKVDPNAKAPPLVASTMADQLLTVMTARVDKYLFTQTGEKTPVQITVTDDKGKSKIITANLPVFSYPYSIRIQAAKLLVPNRSKDVAWGYAERERYLEQMQALIEQTLGVPLDSIDKSKLPKAAAQWIIENSQIASLLQGE